MRLIDVDAFMEEHKHHWDCLSANDMYWKEQLENRTPTIDAVEVVRCCDCKFFVKTYADFMCKEIEYYCDHPCGMIDISYNSFCSYGVRKDD